MRVTAPPPFTSPSVLPLGDDSPPAAVPRSSLQVPRSSWGPSPETRIHHHHVWPPLLSRPALRNPVPNPSVHVYSPMSFTGSAPGPRVSMEITDEMLKSMEVGLACRDYNGRISSMDFHRKDTKYLVTASDDETIRLYDTQDAVCLNTINSKKYGAELVCFTDNPSIVLYSSNNGWDESLRLLSMNDNRFIRYYKGHADRVVCIALCSGKENFISCSRDRTILLWDHRAEKSQGLMRVQRRPTVSYDDQGMVFGVAYGGRIRMFDSRKFGMGPFETFSLGTDDSEPYVLKFSSDGRRILLTTKSGRIHVLNSFAGNKIATFQAKPILTNSTLEASFCPEGKHIISGSGDGSVYAWNIESGKVACWESIDTKPPRVKWSPGSLMFVTGTTELSCWVPDLSKLKSFTLTDADTK